MIIFVHAQIRIRDPFYEYCNFIHISTSMHLYNCTCFCYAAFSAANLFAIEAWRDAGVVYAQPPISVRHVPLTCLQTQQQQQQQVQVQQQQQQQQQQLPVSHMHQGGSVMGSSASSVRTSTCT